jgi:A/G-specific adenine glycosylase
MIDDSAKHAFQTEVWDYYHDHGRHDLPWRQADHEVYRVVVSELMLQQTQVARAIPKYREFLKRFPTVQSLAEADLGDVLRIWSGLGYNRRAKFLWQAARQVVQDYHSTFPEQLNELTRLPGIGSNTAGAILAYAYNQPTVFIETNIRTVYIHHFFHDKTGIADKAILELADEMLDSENPREWYWALMDYGAYLKQSIGNLNRQSKTYARQSTFQDSRRQVRGQVLRLLGERPRTPSELRKQIPDERLAAVLEDLLSEDLIGRDGRAYHL